MGTRENAAAQDFSGIPLEEEEESHLKDAAVISMGTEISVEDMMNIEALCDQVLTLNPAASPPLLLPHRAVCINHVYQSFNDALYIGRCFM